jgi:hypothetical protein
MAAAVARDRVWGSKPGGLKRQSSTASWANRTEAFEGEAVVPPPPREEPSEGQGSQCPGGMGWHDRRHRCDQQKEEARAKGTSDSP